MKKIGFVVPLFLAFSCLTAAWPAEPDSQDPGGDVFLSLTRSAEPRNRLPTNISVTTGEEMRAAGAQTLNDALSLLPGVEVQHTAVPGAFSTVRLRGVPTSNQVQVVVDDQPLGGVSLQNIDIGQIPVEDIDRIEVVRGGSSVLYGASTIGGVIHIITKKAVAGPARSAVGYEARSFDTRIQSAELGKKGNRDDGWIGVRRYTTRGFQDHDDGRGTTVSGNAGHSFDSGARVAVEAYRNDLSLSDPQGTAVPPDQWDGKKERGAVNGQARIDESENRGRLRLNLPVGGSLLQAVAYAGHNHYLSDDPVALLSGFSEVYETDKNLGGADVRAQLPGGVIVGSSYELDEIRVKGNDRFHAEDLGVYSEWTGRAGPWDLLPALRYDHHGNFGGTFNPRATAVFHAGSRVDLSANVARSFRAPDLLQLHQDYPSFFSFHNPDLRPETAWTYDAGVRVRPGDAVSVQATGFLTRFRDLIVSSQNPFPAANTPINAPRAQTSGAEVELEARTGSFSQHASYTYQRTVKNALDRSTRLTVAMTPRHEAAWQGTWEAGRGWALTNGLQYVDERFENDGERGRKLPSYTLWNLRLSKKILGAEFYALVDDVTNKRYADSVSFDQVFPYAPTWTALPGRTFGAGVTLRFNN